MIFKLLLLLFLPVTITLAQTETDLKKTLESVNPDAIKATMTFLSDDLLKGRQPGTTGFEIASKYVETEFIAAGLLPAGDNKKYSQRVPLKKGIVNNKDSKFFLGDDANREEWIYGQEFILTPYMFH